MEQIKGIILNNKDYKLTETAYLILSDFLLYVKKTKKEDVLDIEIQVSIIIDMELESEGKNRIVNEKIIKEVIFVLRENRHLKYTFKKKHFIKDKKTKKNERNKRIKKSFRRDLSSNILGGVCSAIGNFLHIDPIIIRILFIVGAFLKGVLIPVYIILWILIPSEK